MLNFQSVPIEIDVHNINMDYVNEGLAFPHNRDRDGKLLFIFKSKLHIRGLRDSKELIRIFVYWMERMYRFVSFFVLFDNSNEDDSLIEISEKKIMIWYLFSSI